MEVPDVRAMSAGEKPRKYSIGKLYIPDPDEIEKITVKPSTELIPDEYEHEDNKKGLVVIFYSRWDADNMQILKQALTDQNYDVPDANIYEMSTKEFVLESLRNVAQSDHQDKTCFILIFMGNAESRQEDRFLPDNEKDWKQCILIREVWSLFTSDGCPSLRYKPKIFIFQASKKIDLTESDGAKMLRAAPSHGAAYDIPAEADMLLVYKKIEKPLDRNLFIEQLCNNLHYYGHKDDMIGLVTHTDHKDEKRPLIISTLTRKFYLRSSNPRGHHYDLHDTHDAVIEMLQDVNDKIKTIQEQQSVFKRKFEQRRLKKWQESSPTSSNVSQNDDSTGKSKETPKLKSDDSKRVSRATSSASSVDSRPMLKVKKPVKKPANKQPWKF